ncbi:hypothetical protein ACWD3I_43605 [Streptomyces sp. NPDC002817]|uniref:hypothetical protein n=1 Tax=Streptomyces sp. NPDC088357 TaxID=3154655 RepID=UPI0034129656
MDRVDRTEADGPLIRTALSSLDRMGNHEIQRIMSQSNLAQTLAGLIQKKKDEAEKDALGKIG